MSCSASSGVIDCCCKRWTMSSVACAKSADCFWSVWSLALYLSISALTF
ncbi:hypothetical protein MCHI_000113 [Candidatus Magnetoovum chiemensis]|nr:hypothetical protein MCHI_000113 [Candidatus Magnetoovum chiemensis]